MDHFIEEGGQLVETRTAFCEYGGFCRDHAWLFHRRAALMLTGVPVAKMYEALLRQDIARLERIVQPQLGETELDGDALKLRHGYQIFRALGAGASVSIATVSGRGTVTYTDKSVSAQRTYSYTVQASYLGWRSVSSNIATITTPRNTCR